MKTHTKPSEQPKNDRITPSKNREGKRYKNKTQK